MSTKSPLESQLLYRFSCWLTLPILPCLFIIFYLELELLESITLLLAILLPGLWLFYHSYKSMTNVLERIGLQLDSLGNEEYNTWHLASYQGGRIESLKNDFIRLGQRLSDKRLEYMHNESFLFDFIQGLDLPIVVLDHHNQVYSSNQAFNQLTEQSSSQLLGQKAQGLGFVLRHNKWHQLSDSTLSQRVEISRHVFKRSSRNYQLLVLFSIEQQLRDNEKQVWQRLIRVLNHEVRTSLPPIYSMSQSLQEMKLAGPLNEQQQQTERNILQVIEKRAEQLLEFVDSYRAFSKLAPANKSLISSSEVNQRIAAIFNHVKFSQGGTIDFNADLGQLEQALINLIKNATDASEKNSPININWSQTPQQIQIEIIDCGQGIANPDNLFVPFYSTKANGSGIGLLLSRELIRNQGGELTLCNRQNKQGAVAQISLPR